MAGTAMRGQAGLAETAKSAEFDKLVVFGAGLIGGSFALALKAAGRVGEVVGFGRSLSGLRQALELGIVDRVGVNPAHEIPDADLALIATPVAQIPDVMARIAPYLGERTLVTDGIKNTRQKLPYG